MSQDDDFQVEAILDEGVDPSGEKRYFIKWLNFGHDENTWELRRDLIIDGHLRAVTAYEVAAKAKLTSPARAAAAAATAATTTTTTTTTAGSSGSSRRRSKTPTPAKRSSEDSAPRPVLARKEPATGGARRARYGFALGFVAMAVLVIGLRLYADAYPVPAEAQFAAHVLPFAASLFALLGWSNGDPFSSHAAVCLAWLAARAVFDNAWLVDANARTESHVAVATALWTAAYLKMQWLEAGRARAAVLAASIAVAWAVLGSAPVDRDGAAKAVALVAALAAAGDAVQRLLASGFHIVQLCNALGAVCALLVVLKHCGVLNLSAFGQILPAELSFNVAQWMVAVSLLLTPLAKQGL